MHEPLSQDLNPGSFFLKLLIHTEQEYLLLLEAEIKCNELATKSLTFSLVIDSVLVERGLDYLAGRFIIMRSSRF